MNVFLRMKLVTLVLLLMGYHASADFIGTESYTLTINIVGNGTVEIEELDLAFVAKSISQNIIADPTVCNFTDQPCISTWLNGTILELEAIPDSGWEFESLIASPSSGSEIFLPISVGLKGNGESNGPPEIMSLSMFGDRTVTATFTVMEGFDLTTSIVSDGVESDDGGSVSVDPEKSKYDEDDIVTLTANANTGFLFSHWSGNFTEENGTPQKSSFSENNPITIRIENDTDITANFTQSHAVPLSPWAIVLGMVLMLAFFVYRFR